jgi:hypothetical protein
MKSTTLIMCLNLRVNALWFNFNPTKLIYKKSFFVEFSTTFRDLL